MRQMNDETPMLSPEERTSLNNKIGISFLIVFFAFLFYFGYRMHTSPFKSLSETLFEWGLPYVVLTVLVTLLTLEVAYHPKVNNPFRFHAKRFGMNTLMLLGMSLPLIPWVAIVNDVLYRYIGETGSLAIATISWLTLIVSIGLKFKSAITKYWI